MRKFKVVHDLDSGLDCDRVSDYFHIGQELTLRDTKFNSLYTELEFFECRGKKFLSTHFVELKDEL